ncbi:hypothetical protein ETD83_00605 [Actinomadura soli]|uniref:TPM domain-containing protein n=1 Tax=Actinomadura soli TaxID=2508997 RepID=A0A5C4JKN1_9ACTN|nr:hypothetical protein [Actinomadura soli]TMR07511.1 hypothetical protein ETD83_00605 [Actinomadura soli]
MRPGRLFLLALSGALTCMFTGLAGPAAAAPLERADQPSRADHLAAALRRDPVYVTDHAPRSLPPDAAARIRASVARLGVPAYVAVTPTVGLGEENPADSLAALLRDRLGKDGVYIVVDPSGGHGEARQFGGSRRLPVDDAWWAAKFELPHDVSAPDMVGRFVDVALSGRARERRDHPRPRPESATRKALNADDEADRRADHVEMAAFGGGAALSGLPLLGLLVVRRVRRGKRSQGNGSQGRGRRKGKRGRGRGRT